jgi:hypothetical protein
VARERESKNERKSLSERKTEEYASLTCLTGPKELANYLIAVSEDKTKYDRYLAWKHAANVSERFSRKYQRCVFYSSECRLCSK